MTLLLRLVKNSLFRKASVFEMITSQGSVTLSTRNGVSPCEDFQELWVKDHGIFSNEFCLITFVVPCGGLDIDIGMEKNCL